MKKILLFLVCVLGLQVHAQQFNDYFDDATLRIDYTFSGDVHQQHITLDKLNRSPRWYGKPKFLWKVMGKSLCVIMLPDGRFIGSRSLRCSKSGSAMTNRSTRHAVLKTCFSCLCPRIRSISPLNSIIIVER